MILYNAIKVFNTKYTITFWGQSIYGIYDIYDIFLWFYDLFMAFYKVLFTWLGNNVLCNLVYAELNQLGKYNIRRL